MIVLVDFVLVHVELLTTKPWSQIKSIQTAVLLKCYVVSRETSLKLIDESYLAYIQYIKIIVLVIIFQSYVWLMYIKQFTKHLYLGMCYHITVLNTSLHENLSINFSITNKQICSSCMCFPFCICRKEFLDWRKACLSQE